MADLKILILNQYHTDNIGDKLINEMMKREIWKRGYETESLGFAQTLEETGGFQKDQEDVIKEKLKEWCPVWLKYLFKYRRNLKQQEYLIEISKFDAIFIGGGQLIKHKNIFLYCMYHWMRYAQKNRKPLILWGLGVDERFTFMEKLLYKRILKQAIYINVRDQNAADRMKKCFGIATDMVSPDIVFAYCPQIKEEENKDKGYIAVMPYSYNSARKYFHYGQERTIFYETILETVKRVWNREKNAEIILTATTGEDYAECLYLKEYLDRKCIKCSLIGVENAKELVKIYGRCKAVITGRMHAMILAFLCRKEILPLRISDKINGFEREYLVEKQTVEEVERRAEEGLDACLEYLADYLQKNRK